MGLSVRGRALPRLHTLTSLTSGIAVAVASTGMAVAFVSPAAAQEASPTPSPSTSELTLDVWQDYPASGEASATSLAIGHGLYVAVTDPAADGSDSAVCVKVAVGERADYLPAYWEHSTSRYMASSYTTDQPQALQPQACSGFGSPGSGSSGPVVLADGDQLTVSFQQTATSTEQVSRTLVAHKYHDGGVFFPNGSSAMPGETIPLSVYDGDLAGQASTSVSLYPCSECEDTEAQGPYVLTADAAGSDSFTGDVVLDEAVFQTGQTWFARYADLNASDGSTVPRVASLSVGMDSATTGVVAGTVTAKATSAAVEGICVDATSAYDTTLPAVSTTTAASGAYELALEQGRYLVEFSDCRTTPAYAPMSIEVDVLAGDRLTRNAALELSAAVSGTVTKGEGGALAGACVRLYDVENWSSSAAHETTTGDDGTYAVTGVPAGSYHVEFADCAGGGHRTEWFSDAAHRYNATPIALASGEERTGLDAVLVKPASIAGTVRTDSGAAVKGTCVYGSPFDSGSSGSYWSATSGVDGTYLAENVAPGSYRVSFSDCSGTTHYPQQYFDRTTDYSAAEAVTVASGANRTGVDAALTPYGRLFGTAKRQGSTSTDSICVVAHSTQTGGGSVYAYTRSDGTYDLYLPAGSYQLLYRDCSGTSGEWAQQWYDGKPSRATADAVTVVVDTETELTPVALLPAGRISGTARSADGAAVSDVCVSAQRADEIASRDYFHYGSVRTAADGTWTLGGLSAGEYVIMYYDCLAGGISRWYDGATSAADAARVAVTSGETTTGIVLRLPSMGKVTGTVTGAGSAAEGICVVAFTANGAGSYRWIGSAQTATDGRYTLRTEAVKAVIRFTDCNDDPSFVPQVYNGKGGNDFQNADLVTVPVNGTAAGIDAMMVPGVKVSGTARGSDGTPVGSMSISAVPASNPDGPGRYANAEFGYTAKDGTWSLLAPAGSYKFEFYPHGGDFLPEWYQDKKSFAEADSVALEVGSPRVLDVTLAKASVIDGVVSSAAGGVFANACVHASNTTAGEPGGFSHTDAAGAYRLRVAPGTYKLHFNDCGQRSPRFAPEWFENQYDHAQATPVTVAAEAVVTKNATVSPYTAVAGTVRNSASSPLKGICVQLWSTDGTKVVASAKTTAEGTYRATAIPGTYKVRFHDCATGDLATVWSGGGTSFAAATTVQLTSTADVTSNATMSAPAADEPPTKATTSSGSVSTDASGDVLVTMPTGRRSDVTITKTITCPSGQALNTATVDLVLGGTAHRMTATANAGEFRVTIPAASVTTGELILRFTCGSSIAVDSAGEIVLYDPSGLVTNKKTGEPVVGATVTLHKVSGWRARTSSAENTTASTCESNLSKPAGATWSQPAPSGQDEPLDPASGMFSPSVLQQTTTAIGYYGWDVAEGCWYVTVAKTGFKAHTSPVVGVPPEVTDLHIALEPDSCTTGADADSDGVNDICDRVDDVHNTGEFPYSYVRRLQASGVTRGCGSKGEHSTLYCPYADVSRAEMAIFLVRALGQEGNLPAAPWNSFADVVAEGSPGWYAPYAEKLRELGVTIGCNGGKDFCPYGQVSRAEMAIFLTRALGGTAADTAAKEYTGPSSFNDVPKEFVGYVEYIRERKITGGTNAAGTTFEPYRNVRRDEMSKFLAVGFNLPTPND